MGDFVKKTISILSTALALIVCMQSCMSTVVNILSTPFMKIGATGYIMAVCILLGGIIGYAKKDSRIGTIVAASFYGVGAIVSLTTVVQYTDSWFTAGICVLFGGFYVWSLFWKSQENINITTREKY